MARVKSIRFAARATVNLGDYENNIFEYEETIELVPGDNATQLREQLIRRVNRVIENQVLESRRDSRR